MRLRDNLIGDISGAFADLGTFLPLVIGLIVVGGFDATGVLAGFGLFAFLTGALYRRPIPVQPMKVMAAAAIAGGLTAGAVAAGGILLGLALLLLAGLGLIDRMARFMPQSVLAGLQLGIGVHLVLIGAGLLGDNLVLGLLALAALLLLQTGPFRSLACLATLAGAVAWGLLSGAASLPSTTIGLYLPQFGLPGWHAFVEAVESAVLPQLALTLTNAVLMTATIAVSYFPGAQERVTARNLAFSSGAANLLLAPFGAMPMCHGAGGLVVQHKYGARSGLAPAAFGAACLALAVLTGPGAAELLMMVPLAAVGALLILAGQELALSKRLFDSKPSCLFVILLTAAAALAVNIAAALVLGLVAETIRGKIVRSRVKAASGR